MRQLYVETARRQGYDSFGDYLNVLRGSVPDESKNDAKTVTVVDFSGAAEMSSRVETREARKAARRQQRLKLRQQEREARKEARQQQRLELRQQVGEERAATIERLRLERRQRRKEDRRQAKQVHWQTTPDLRQPVGQPTTRQAGPQANNHAASDRVGGVCILRDARDIVPFLCGHYLRIGFDRILFIDDGSSDGTYQFLLWMSRREPRIRVERVETPLFMQAAEVSRGANLLIGDGIRLIFPFDSDEFWNLRLAEVRSAAATTPAGLIVGKWVMFVQDRRRPVFRGLAPMAVRHRAPALLRLVGEAIDRGIPPVCRTKPKIAFKADGPVEIGRGQHILNEGPTNVLAQDLEVFHLPLRSTQEIDGRSATVVRYPTRKQRATLREVLQEMLAYEAREEIWRKNSVGPDGCLDTGDRLIPTIPDTRLRILFAKAWLYMASHHPAFPFVAARSRSRS